MKISVDIEIDKPKDLVWSAISDIENWANMITGIIDLKVIKKPEEGIVGLKWIETRKLFGKESSEAM
jgi:carbon monoxide dehydrogenase subunit G